MSQFDDEILLQSHPDGRFTGRIHSSWNIGSSPNGGYLMAVVGKALGQRVAQHPDPLSITAHYLRPCQGDADCEIDTQLLRSGATLSTLRAGLCQQDTLRLEVMASFGDLGSASIEHDIAPPAPAMPDAGHCIARSGDAQGIALHIASRLDIRLHPQQARAGSTGAAIVSGWVRFLDGRDPDPLALLLFADAFPPSLFGLLGAVGWVPTIELTVQVLRRPAPGWIQGQFHTVSLANDRMIEDGALWDSAGQLVAQSRQLAVLRRKP